MPVRLRADALLLDFNGTLSNDEDVLHDVYAAMLAARGRPLTRQEYVARLAGRSDAEIFHALLGDEADVESLTAERVARYRDVVADGATVNEERRDAVRLAAAWVPVVVVTSAWRAEVAPVLDASDVQGLLAGVVCADDVERHKPAPDAYLAALELAGVRPERALAIEDSEAGVAAARAAGIPCVALTTTMPASRLRDANVLLPALSAASVAALLLG